MNEPAKSVVDCEDWPDCPFYEWGLCECVDTKFRRTPERAVRLLALWIAIHLE